MGVLGWAQPPKEVGSESRPTPDGPANSRMPVRNITLYRSGVGYFERRATVGKTVLVP